MHANGLYFGTSGLSLSNKFTVTSSGNVNIGDKLKFDGTSLTFSSDVTLSWGQVTGTSGVANKSDIPTDVNQLNDASGQKWSTTVGNTWIKTANVYAQNLSVASANISGTISCDKLNGGTISGQQLSGCTGDFTGTVKARTIIALNSYYICDTDFGNNVKIISYIPDTTSDTEYKFGRLSSNGYGSGQNCIAFKDMSQDRQCRIYSGYLEVHAPIYSDNYIYCGRGCSFHVMTKGDGLTSDACGWLVRFADGSNHNNMIMLGNSNYNTSVYGSGHIWKNGSSTTYLSTASTSSDKRLKEYVSDLSHLENFFMQLSPIGFKYHDGLYNAEGTKPAIQWGFYAQDIIKDFEDNGMDWQDYDLVLKEMTDISKEEREYIDDICDGILKVSYRNFTALNTYMIQQVYKDNKWLHEDNEQMKKKIYELEQKITELFK